MSNVSRALHLYEPPSYTASSFGSS
jgi:hypothetical protein